MNLFILTGLACLLLIAVLLLLLRYVGDPEHEDELESDGEIPVLYWPNGTWCYRWELEQMNHMSDDFTEILVPTYFDYEDIERRIHTLNGGK